MENTAVQIMENEFLKVTIANHSAELVSVWDKENGRERIWNADPAVWNRHAPLLFPFVGRVNGSVYRYNGMEYPMKSQHGFARDMEFACVSVEEDKIVHCLKADDATQKIYPFDFELYVTHQFAEANGRLLEVKWEICNCGENEMFYSIGGHPGFMVPEKEGETREQYFLEFPGKEELSYILVNPDTALAVPDVEYPLPTDAGYVQITTDMFDKDALIFEKSQLEVVGIARPDCSPYVRMYCSGFPYLGIWSKPDARYVCLEPWCGRTDNDGFAGTIQEKEGEMALPAGETKMITYGMEFFK